MKKPTIRIYPHPEFVEREGQWWLKLRIDRLGNTDRGWLDPDSWHEPVDGTIIEHVLNDSTLESFDGKLTRLEELTGRSRSLCRSALTNKKWEGDANCYMRLDKEAFESQKYKPVLFGDHTWWLYRGKLARAFYDGPVNELALFIKHKILSEERALAKVQREVQAFESFEKLGRNQREPIPENVRMFVWQRDKGRCVRCGSQERLEYDHIIALANGGSNTERNIQILCESCNRSKGSSV